MALRKKETNKVEDHEVEPNKVEVPVETRVEATPEIKEVAVKAKQEVAVVTDDAPSLASLEDAFDPIEFGNTFPRVVGASGGVKCDTLQFGEYIDIQVVSKSDRWMVTPKASQSDKQAKRLCRASYDGKAIPAVSEPEHILIEDYIDGEMAEAGYKPNNVGKYKDLYALIFSADKNVEEAEELGLVQISVSPTAVKALNAFIMQTKFKVKRGQMLASHQNCIRVQAEARSGDSGDYTVLTFKTVPIDVVKTYTPITE